MNSKRPVVPEGFDPHARQLAVRDGNEAPSGRSARIRRLLGLIWCFIGSALAPLVPVLSCVLIAYGFAVISSGGSRRERLAALLVALAAGTANTLLLFGVYGLPMTTLEVLCAYALASELVAGRLRTAGVLLEVAVLTCALIGVDTVSTSLQGATIEGLITTVVNQSVESLMGSVDLDGATALLQTRDTLVVLWPTLYFLVAAGIAACSVFGAWIGAKLSGVRVEPGMLARYDVPLWVAELFAVGVAAQLIGPHLPAWREEVATIGANVVACTRIALVQQGLSVLLWWTRERRAPRAVGVSVTFLAVWLELSFAVASVAGLVDVVVNFRRLRRTRPDLIQRPARER